MIMKTPLMLLSSAVAVGVLFAWLWPLHEFWHFAACVGQGFPAWSNWVNHTTCEGIKSAPGWGMFLYFMAPYLAGLAAVTAASRWKVQGLWWATRASLPLIVILDVLINYTQSLEKQSDFTQLAAAAPSFFWLGVVVVLGILLLGVRFCMREWRGVKMRI